MKQTLMQLERWTSEHRIKNFFPSSTLKCLPHSKSSTCSIYIVWLWNSRNDFTAQLKREPCDLDYMFQLTSVMISMH